MGRRRPKRTREARSRGVGTTAGEGAGPGLGESILEAVEDAFEHAPPSPEAPHVPTASMRPPSARSEARPNGLASPDADTRRRALDGIVATAAREGDLEPVIRILLTDPDPGTRRRAAEALATSPVRPARTLIERVLLDPDDRVRAAGVELATRRGGRAGVELLVPLVGERAWPLTQRAAVLGLAQIARTDGLTPEHLARLLERLARMDPPPIGPERPAFQELARAIGPERLAAELSGPDDLRLGAARLLMVEGSPSSIHSVAALANDPLEAVRRLVGAAAATAANSPPPRADRSWRPDAAGPPSAGEDTPAGAMIFALSRALTDPEERVRAQARADLSLAPRDLLRAWAERWLQRGDQEVAAAAARLVEHLAMPEPAAVLLERACRSSERDRAPYLRALAALALESEDLAALAETVDPALRPVAVHLVWRVGGHDVLTFLVSMLEDSAGAVRMSVLEVFAESADTAAARLARELLANDSSAAVRATAVHVVAELGGEERPAALTQALGDPDPDVRSTALEALPDRWGPAADDPESVPSPSELLLRALGDEDARVGRAAAARIVRLSVFDPAMVWRAIAGSGPSIRADIVRELERTDRPTLAALALARARDPSPADRALAVDLAGRAATPESTRVVIDALGDPDPGVRKTAATAMSVLRSPLAVGALSRSLSDPQPDVRVEAVHALGLIDDDDVPWALITALKDPEVRVRQVANEALVRWRSPAVARRLVVALSSPDLRGPAGEALERIGRAAVRPLVEAVSAEDPEIAAFAGALLERIVGPDPFLGDLGSTDSGTRLRAVEVLGVMGGRTASEALVGTLGDPEASIRIRAATLLGSLRDPRAIPHLRRTFLSDPVVEVAAAAEAALQRLERPSDRELEEFRAWMGDEPTGPEGAEPEDPGDPRTN
jgi:HEAT repeat protein